MLLWSLELSLVILLQSHTHSLTLSLTHTYLHAYIHTHTNIRDAAYCVSVADGTIPLIGVSSQTNECIHAAVFYDSGFYRKLTEGRSDRDVCFMERNGQGSEHPRRKDLRTGQIIAKGTRPIRGYFEGEDTCSDIAGELFDVLRV